MAERRYRPGACSAARRRPGRQEFDHRTSLALAVAGMLLAGAAISASLGSPYMVIYAFVPLLGGGLLLRRGGHLSQRFRELQQLQSFTRALGNERGARTLDIGLVELLQIMRTRSAGLAVVARSDNLDTTVRMICDDTFRDVDADPIAELLVGLVDDGSVTQIDFDDPREDARTLLRYLTSGSVLAVRILDGVHGDGVLFVADRLGMRSDFSADELSLFGSLADTLGSRLSNDHLVGLLESQARTDALTGLPNRLSFEIAVTSSVAGRDGGGAIVMLDLDRFKEINDSLGHDTGDRLLVEVADRLRRFARSTDMIARFGGDEFAVLLRHIDPDDPDELDRRVTELHESLTAKVELEGITFEVCASLGAVHWPEQGSDSSHLIRRADTAMYEAKRNRHGVIWYQPELDADAPRRLDLYLSVSSALAAGDFYVQFQPKVSLTDGRITGAEALVRWTHPTHGPIAPSEFVPLIVQAGMIGTLTRFVLQSAAEAAMMLRSAGRELRIAVNFTPRDLLDATLVEDLERILERIGAEPSMLQIEITEDAMVVDHEMSIAMLKQLRDLGIRVAIDDFGTGYSSLKHLHQLPIDELKIDRSFISRMDSDNSAAAIVRASINLANDLSLTTVAEGIEDDRVLGTLAHLGCREAQGFLVGRPMPAHDLVRWVCGWSPDAFANRLCEPTPSTAPTYLVGVDGSLVSGAPVVSGRLSPGW